jgi:HK97 family phage major capsid protein
MEFGYKLDDVILNGSGAGQGLGVLNSNALVQVAKRTGQKADSILFENIVDMDAQLADASDSTAFWIANRETKPELALMTIAVGTGGVPVYLPANGAAGRPSQELYGRKMVTMEQASALGDVGDLMLFDPNEYIFIDKGGIQSAVSIHVQFLTDESTFRWTYRYNGQPLRSSPLSPAKGSKARSPFVAIAQRS